MWMNDTNTRILAQQHLDKVEAELRAAEKVMILHGLGGRHARRQMLLNEIFKHVKELRAVIREGVTP
jgi:hypothetical protein